MASDLQGVSTDLATTQNAENQAAGGLQDTANTGTLADTTGDALTTMGNDSLETGAVKAINDANGSRNINETANQNDGKGTITLGKDGATGVQTAEGTSTGGGANGGGGGGGCGDDGGGTATGDTGATATGTGTGTTATATGTKTNNDTGAAGQAGLVEAATQGGETAATAGEST